MLVGTISSGKRRRMSPEYSPSKSRDVVSDCEKGNEYYSEEVTVLI